MRTFLLLLGTLLPSATAQIMARPPSSLQIADPRYTTLSMSIDISAPAEKVWARVGKFCDIGEWAPAADGSKCRYVAGDGDVGTVRSVVSEVMVGKTPLSYTYVQAPRVGTPYSQYHGTMEVIPLSSSTSRLDYTLFFDTSTLATEPARIAYIDERRSTFQQRMQNMKVLAEGGRLVVPTRAVTARGSIAAPAPAPFASPNPHYVVVPLHVDINASVDTVWSYVGHFCDIAKLSATSPCNITGGEDGEYGAMRNIGDEVLVGKTKYSYVYTQRMRKTGFHALLHGALEARATGANTSTLYWTLVYDDSNLPDDAAKSQDINTRREALIATLANAKILSEGGTVTVTRTSSATQ